VLGTLSSTSIDSVSSLNLLYLVCACQPRGPQWMLFTTQQEFCDNKDQVTKRVL
jgi:hypothetical protein